MRCIYRRVMCRSCCPSLCGEWWGSSKNLTPQPSSLRKEGEFDLSSPPALGEGFFQIAVPHVGNHFHPLAAVYRFEVLPHVRELLAADRLRAGFLFDAVPTRIIEPHELADIDPEFRSLQNVNTPEEYEDATPTELTQRHQAGYAKSPAKRAEMIHEGVR